MRSILNCIKKPVGNNSDNNNKNIEKKYQAIEDSYKKNVVELEKKHGGNITINLNQEQLKKLIKYIPNGTKFNFDQMLKNNEEGSDEDSSLSFESENFSPKSFNSDLNISVDLKNPISDTSPYDMSKDENAINKRKSQQKALQRELDAINEVTE